MSAVSKDSEPPGAGPVRATGVVLAGGLSRRYGRDKALAPLEGIPLVKRVINAMTSVFEHVIVIANSSLEYAHLGVPIHQDLVTGIGPLGGIYTGLKIISDDRAFFAACDMPFLNRSLIRHMAQLSQGWEAVVPRMGWKIEALHAFYSRRCLQAVEDLIASETFQIAKLFPRVRVRYVEEDEIRRYDPQLRSFFNVNLPQELVAAQKIAGDK